MLRPRWWLRIWHWEAECTSVLEAYPGAKFREIDSRGAWVVPMRPIPESLDLNAVVADLELELPVRILVSGQLSHSPMCQRPRLAHELRVALSIRKRTYEVVLELPETHRGSAGDVNPNARIPSVIPLDLKGPNEISAKTHPTHPHLSGDGRGDSWACPLPPHDTDWGWKPGAIVQYLDYVAIWILKTEIWERTGHWVGPAVSHLPADVLSIEPGRPCRCGRGEPYGDCHRRLDLAALLTTTSRR